MKETKMDINKAIELLKKDGPKPKEDYRSICKDTKGFGICGACGAC